MPGKRGSILDRKPIPRSGDDRRTAQWPAHTSLKLGPKGKETGHKVFTRYGRKTTSYSTNSRSGQERRKTIRRVENRKNK